MTKAEARLTLQENLSYLTSVHHQRIIDAIKVAIEVLSEPTLPTNLDEAVFAHEDSSEYPPSNQEEERMVYDAFKAGADWMGRAGKFNISPYGTALKDENGNIAHFNLEGFTIEPN